MKNTIMETKGQQVAEALELVEKITAYAEQVGYCLMAAVIKDDAVVANMALCKIREMADCIDR